MPKQETQDALRFTKMCKYWSLNRCHMGYQCTFAHSSAELQEAPCLVGTELCFQFNAKGRCKKGARCNFAHGKEELRNIKEAAVHRSQVEPQLSTIQMNLSDETIKGKPPGLEAQSEQSQMDRFPRSFWL